MKEYRKNDVLEQVKQSVTDDVQLEFDFSAGFPGCGIVRAVDGREGPCRNA